MNYFISKAGSQPASEHAAVWVPDNASPTCMACKKNFTVLNRRVRIDLFRLDLNKNAINLNLNFNLMLSITVATVELWSAARVPKIGFYFQTNPQNQFVFAMLALKR